MKLLLMFVLMMPIVFAYLNYEEAEAETKMSLTDIEKILERVLPKITTLAECMETCGNVVHGFWVFLCDPACKLFLSKQTT